MSVPAYETYRDSGVPWLGAVPSHWNAVRLRRLVEIKKRIAGEEGPDVLSVTQRGIKVRDTESNDGQLAASYAHYQLVEPGDFAMNHMDLLTGWVDISPQHGVTSPDYRVFSVRWSAQVDPRYLLRVLQLGYIGRTFFALGQGSSHLGRWRLPADAFNDFEVALPPLAEQTAIAAFLDRETGKIEALVEAQRRLIELLKEKRQAVISHAVTKGLDPAAPMKDSGIEWLGEVPAHWEVKRLSTEASFFQGKAHEPFVEDEGEHIYVSARFVSTAGEAQKNCTINLSPAKQGDILMVMSDLPNGRALARAFLVPDDRSYAVNQRVCSIRFERGSPNFFAYQLNRNKQLLQFNDGVEQTHLKNSAFTKLSLAVPPVEEQRAIAAWLDQRVAAWDRLMNDAERATIFLQERRAALISAAVTGKIDVRSLVADQTERDAA